MNLREITRYLKIKGEADADTVLLIEKMYEVCRKVTFFKRTAKLATERTKQGILLKGTEIVLQGSLAARHFDGCEYIYAVLASLGQESERKLREVFSVSPKEAVVLDACYSEFLERKLDETEEELKEKDEIFSTRISCGYGDLPLATQRPILELLDGKRIGVFMNESCMLTPNKSAIALIGVKKTDI